MYLSEQPRRAAFVIKLPVVFYVEHIVYRLAFVGAVIIVCFAYLVTHPITQVGRLVSRFLG